MTNLPLQAEPRSWLGNGRGAAYASALCLVAIQVSIGIIMKSSQTGGHYKYSESACITISEFFKLLLSTCFFYAECRTRNTGYIAAHTALPSSPRSSTSTMELMSVEETKSMPIDGEVKLSWRQFITFIKTEASVDATYGFAKLALLYSFVNNTIFVAYKLADPGTISITKSGVTFITALVMIATVGTKITKIQWTAIMVQICGLFISQYRAETGISYPTTTYAVLLFQVFLSAISGVYNQALLASDEYASLHAHNMILYSSGTAINFILHLTLRLLSKDEPGFFTGYNTVPAVLVIVSNVFIGLAITAVYKYADAVVKCLATAVATGILLYISPILFAIEMSPLIIPGGLIVFISSWLYMEAAPPKDQQQGLNMASTAKKSLFGVLAAFMNKFPKAVLIICTIVTITAIPLLKIFCDSIPDFRIKAQQPAIDEEGPTLRSPFENTLAMVRWNSNHPDRMPLLRKYAPFYHTLHFSMPDYLKDENVTRDYHNITHDSHRNGLLIYLQVSKTMQLILDAAPGSPESNITGIHFFHFDAWVDPLAFAGEDLDKIWMPLSIDRGRGEGPTYTCMTSVGAYANWPGFQPYSNWQVAALKSSAAIIGADLGYKINPEEWCVGWSDFYYMPRHLFADYILLSAFFGAFETFQEIAIPTIMHIIDSSRREFPYSSIMEHFEDCFGGCCSDFAHLDDVVSHRCGHKLNYVRDEGMVNATYNRLDYEAGILGVKLNDTRWWADRHSKTSNKTLGGLTESTRLAIEKLYSNLRQDDQTAWPAAVNTADSAVDADEAVKAVEVLIGGDGVKEVEEVEGMGIGQGFRKNASDPNAGS